MNTTALSFSCFLLVALGLAACDDDDAKDRGTGGAGAGGESTVTTSAGTTTATSTATSTGATSSSSTGSGSPDDDPQPAEVVIDGLAAPFAIAAGADRIYWSDVWEGTNAIVSCDPEDCPATAALVASDQGIPTRGLRYAAGNIFWATGEGVFTCTPSACKPQPLHAGPLDVTALATDGTVTFYADDATDTIYGVEAGSPPAVVATGVSDVRGITIDGASITFSIYGISRNPPHSEILRCPTDGCDGAPEALHGTTESLGAHGVAAVGGHVYWTEVGHLRRCPTAGCTNAAEEIGPASSASFEVLAAYDDRLAWAAWGLHFYSCERDDCAATTVAYDGGTLGQDLSLGETHVYVISSSMPLDGRISRIPR